MENELIYNLLLIYKLSHDQKRKTITCIDQTSIGFLFYLDHNSCYLTIYLLGILRNLCSNLKTIDFPRMLVHKAKIAGSQPKFFKNLYNVSGTKAGKLQRTYNYTFVMTFSIVKTIFIYIMLNASDFITLINIMLTNF